MGAIPKMTNGKRALIVGGSMSGNRGHGILATDVDALAAVEVTADANLGGGLLAQHGNTVSIFDGSYSLNWGAGFLPTVFQGTAFKPQGEPIDITKRIDDTS